MARKVAISTLNASTLDILNTIRANASAEYQSLVPEITKASEIPSVGQSIMGYPALANQFLSALLNRIALVKIKSARFNNPYRELKKGYLEFGETVEEVFVQIAKAREFSAEKAEARELKRSIPDVRAAFHTMNWRVQYPVTVQDEDLNRAFMSIEGVQDLIARIVDSVYTASYLDEYLLFKYLIIKAVSHGHMYPVEISGDLKASAVAFRGTSNKLTFMSNKYNDAGVTTATPKSEQYIFMASDFNAEYDVDVLSAAFNMDKADFTGRLMLIDDFTTFDNTRFSEIAENSDMIEPVTDAELALMGNVKAVLVDSEWFQVYDNLDKFTEKYVASGLYWNYFYNVWKTVCSSPFSNAVVFVDESATLTPPSTITLTVTDISKNAGAAVYTLIPADIATLRNMSIEFVQDDDATEAGIAVHKYGAVIIPIVAAGETQPDYVARVKIGESSYTAATAIDVTNTAVGDTITLDLDT